MTADNLQLTKGLLLKDKIVRTTKSVNLRANSCKVELEILMHGVSFFTLLLRSGPA